MATRLLIRYSDVYSPEHPEDCVKEYNRIHDFPGLSIGLHAEYVSKVTASGEFLNLIARQFTGLPNYSAEKQDILFDAVTWYGDHAKFIVGNLEVRD